MAREMTLGLTFNVIINPNSGPPLAFEDGIKIDWALWIGQINNRPNTYKPSPRTSPSSSKGSIPTPHIHMDGIFFDEVNTAPAQLQYYTDITNYAKSATGVVVLNPGVAVNPASSSLYTVADAILSLETNTYTPFTPAVGIPITGILVN
ncbi:hypothetical protein CCUS01_07259 [Colletotrichum cuscutae]|uniref:Uncharacterized protein n=1 Tax=Colletotrichum cuscutae TaxID=1209917 RepID=A0AAI9XZJ2_9PEZI|nr:hypothetical protein CCUS01_07259 [Colletotrichum cuscutae]